MKKRHRLDLRPSPRRGAGKLQHPGILLSPFNQIRQRLEFGISGNRHCRRIPLDPHEGIKIPQDVCARFRFDGVDEMGRGDGKNLITFGGLLGDIEHPLGRASTRHIGDHQRNFQQGLQSFGHSPRRRVAPSADAERDDDFDGTLGIRRCRCTI